MTIFCFGIFSGGRSAISASIHRTAPSDTQFILDPKLDFYVRGNIFDPSNWEKTAK